MPGDGIGKVVLPEAIRVLDAVGFDAEYVHADIGWEFWINEGNALPERTVELLAGHKLGLFGAITSKPKKQGGGRAQARAPRTRVYVYFSPIVGMRQRFNLDVCIRPCRSFPGNPLNFIRRTADGGFEEPPVDAVIFRQNTEGLYAGVEWTNPPPAVREALATHPKFKAFAQVAGRGPGDQRPDLHPRAPAGASSAPRSSTPSKHGYKSVTVCEKPNVLRETSGMMEEVAKEVAEGLPRRSQLWSTNIDAQMMWLTKNPEDYGVIVAGNLFGDIVSDAFAGLVGGLGFACSGNIGDEVAVFEPTHGSAPKYDEARSADRQPDRHDPLRGDAARPRRRGRRRPGGCATRSAAVVGEGKVRTYDMMRLAGRPGCHRAGRGDHDADDRRDPRPAG